MDDLTDSITQRLKQLLRSVQQDSQLLQSDKNSSSGGEVVFQQLFDAIQSTLQNVEASPVDDSVSDSVNPK